MTEGALVPYKPPTIILDKWGIERWSMPHPRTSPLSVPESAMTATAQGAGLLTLVSRRGGYVTNTNAGVYRAWSEASPWVRAAIDILRDQVSSAEWDIIPLDREGKRNVRLGKRIRELLEQPNPRDSFWEFIQMMIEDLCVLDAGVAEKVRTPMGDLVELWPVAGEFVWVNARWDGSDPDQIRFIFAPDGNNRGEFKNSDLIYGMQNPRANSAVGLSPLEVLKQTIDAEMRGSSYNAKMVMGAPPEGVLNIGESASPTDVVSAKHEWESEILGQSNFAIIGGYKAPSWISFRSTNQEMQFREWLDYLVRQHAIVFGLSPMDLGITFDVNRSTADAQSDNTEGRGLKPLMAMLGKLITRHVVQDDSYGGKENNLQFVWTALNIKESQAKANINKVALGSTPWKTVNEARIMEGRQPLGDPTDENNIFNCIVAQTPKGMLNISRGTYLGEEQLAKVAADAQISVEGAKGEIAAANADQPNQPAPQDKPRPTGAPR